MTDRAKRIKRLASRLYAEYREQEKKRDELLNHWFMYKKSNIRREDDTRS